MRTRKPDEPNKLSGTENLIISSNAEDLAMAIDMVIDVGVCATGKQLFESDD